MRLDFINKKLGLIISLTVLGFCFSMNNASCAETVQDSSSITSLSPQENNINTTNNLLTIQSEEPVFPAVVKTAENQTEPTTPAVNIQNNNEIDADKNIVPVLDLKGGIQTQEVKKETPLEIWLNQDKATGDWKGLRTKLEEHGVTITGSYMTTVFTKGHSGGLLYKRGTSYQGLVNTAVEFDTEKMRLYPGGKLFVLFQNAHGKGLSGKYVGDAFVFNNADAGKKTTQLSEYWYEQSLFDNKLRFIVGKQDANCEFQALDTGFEFINSGFNFMPNSSLTAYPDAAMGLVAAIQPTENTYIKYGFFDGQGVGSESGFNTVFHKNDTYKHFGEIGITPSIKRHPGKYLIGMWHNTENTDELLSDDAINSGIIAETFPSNQGFYAEFEQMVFKEKPDSEDSQGLTVLGQFGWAPPKKTEMSKYFGTAVAYKGLIPNRNEDLFGVGINFANFSKRLGHIKNESVLEVFYKICLTPWLYIQPDFQYINKPFGADDSVIVFGIRTGIEF